MNIEQVQPLRQNERRDWVRPAISRLNAGSAENDVGPREDLAVNIS